MNSKMDVFAVAMTHLVLTYRDTRSDMTKKERKICRKFDKALGLTVGTHEILCTKFNSERKNAIINAAKKEMKK